MPNPPEEICPHCKKRYKTIVTQQDSREVICYYCQKFGDAQRIECPKCGGDKRFCEWEYKTRVPLRSLEEDRE